MRNTARTALYSTVVANGIMPRFESGGPPIPYSAGPSIEHYTSGYQTSLAPSASESTAFAMENDPSINCVADWNSNRKKKTGVLNKKQKVSKPIKPLVQVLAFSGCSSWTNV